MTLTMISKSISLNVIETVKGKNRKAVPIQNDSRMPMRKSCYKNENIKSHSRGIFLFYNIRQAMCHHAHVAVAP